jgi:hypothetical protein
VGIYSKFPSVGAGRISPKTEKQTQCRLAPLYGTDGDVLPINGINPPLLGKGAAN